MGNASLGMGEVGVECRGVGTPGGPPGYVQGQHEDQDHVLLALTPRAWSGVNSDE